MPKRSQTFQAGFQKGIVENVQQDALGRQGTLESALYIDNYNPNLEMLTLVKRLCYAIIGQWEAKTKTNMPSYADLSSLVSSVQLNVFAYGNIQIEMMYDNSEKRVFFIRATSGSGINQITFTRVIDLSHTWNSGTNLFEWCNALSRAYPDYYAAALYPGYDAPGVYTHHVRYGNTLLFTTMPNYKYDNITFQNYCANISDHFPVYVYYKWNLNNKRRNEAGEDRNCVFWNGIVFPNGGLSPLPALPNAVYNQWKIKSPSTKTLNVGLVSCVLTAEEGASTKWTTDIATISKDIEIVIIESATHKTSLWPNYPLYQQHLPTLEILDGVYKGKTIDTNESYVLSQERPNDIFPYIARCSYSPAYKAIDYSFYDDKGDSRKVTVLSSDGNNPYSFEMNTNSKEYMYLTIPYYVPLYKENKTPRPWLQGEKIPLCLTATIDGVEVVIWQGTHTVQTASYIGEVKSFDGVGELYEGSGTSFYRDTGTSIYVAVDQAWLNLGPADNAIQNAMKIHIRANCLRISENQYIVPTYWYEAITLAGPTAFYNPRPLIDLYQHRTCLMFTVRLKKETFDNLLDMNIQSLKLYCSKPDLNDNIWRSYGTLTYPADINPATFAKPIVKSDNESDYTQYALLKEFMIEGAGTPNCVSMATIPSDYKTHNGTPLTTNGWFEHATTHDIYAIPQLKYAGTFPLYADENPSIGALPKIPFGSPTFGSADLILTPDFILYDYPLDAPPLLLNNSGKYWKGKGAGGLVVVKGCTFLINCYDKDGELEQAVIRYSAVQNGNISPDVFPVENKLVIGHLPHTGAANYREQLLWFNRQSHYRMMIPTVTQPETWEFLDSIEGHGAFMQKAICVTPEGVCYCNENGIWITDGRIPQSLTFTANSSIESLYKYIATNAAYIYTQTVNPGQGLVNAQKGYNEYIELSYCADTDELIFSSPLHRYWKTLGGNTDYYTPINTPTYSDLNIEIRLIYHFKTKNWRVEHTNMKTTEDVGVTPISVDFIGATQYGPMKLSGAPYHAAWIDRTNQIAHVATNQTSTGREVDELDYIDGVGEHQVFPSSFMGHVITHEIGDDENDSMMLRVILEAKPRQTATVNAALKSVQSDINYWPAVADPVVANQVNTDPVFGYETRNLTWQWATARQRIVDLIKINMLRKLPFVNGFWTQGNPWRTRLETPNEPVGAGQNLVNIRASESLFLNVPINSYFRHCRFMLSSEYIIKVHGFTVEYTTFKRRGQ